VASGVEMQICISTFGSCRLLPHFVLDGRNRWLACEMAGVEPVTEPFEGDDAEALRYVVRANVRRRHLTPSQIAMAGADIANMKVGNPTFVNSPITSREVIAPVPAVTSPPLAPEAPPLPAETLPAEPLVSQAEAAALTGGAARRAHGP